MPLTLEISGLLGNLVASGLYDLLKYGKARGWRALRGEEGRMSAVVRAQADEALQAALESATRTVAAALEPADTSPEAWRRADRMKQFLAAPEAVTFAHELFLIAAEPAADDGAVNVRRDLDVSLALYLNESVEAVQDIAAPLFEGLSRAARQAISVGIRDGVLAAHEAASAERHRALAAALAHLNDKLALLTQSERIDVPAVEAFEVAYRKEVHAATATISPPHLDAAPRVPIGELYVAPALTAWPSSARNKRPGQRLTLSELVERLHRTVVLGMPGGGKSTLVQRLSHELSAQEDTPTPDRPRRLRGRRVTPIIVVLREYAARREAYPDVSILDFVRSTAHASQQWPSVPHGAFEYLLASGRAAVFFDGLDELLDTGARREVTAAVEAFARRYPNVPILVTSREVGYTEAALDRTEFSTYVLDGFARDDAREYVRRRFRLEGVGTPSECSALADAFIRESEAARDLRTNPLMLGLLCTIYRGEGYIPQNRPAVYEKCALMLFERWDRRRRIATPFSYDEDLGPIVQHLAHWIYANQKLQNGVPEDALIHAAANYLRPRRFEDRDRAVGFAREFVEHCRGRAWVFTDVGSTGEGDPLYQFTHRTFLEYFAAAHLVRQHPTPDRLSTALLPRIARVEWDVVAQLAIQIQSRQVEDASSEHLTRLLQSAALVGPGPAGAIVAFATRLLAFLTPTPAVTRSVVAAAFRHAVIVCSTGRRGAQRPGRNSADSHLVASTLLQAIIGVAPRNRVTAAEEIQRVCLELSANPDYRATAVAFGCTLDSVVFISEEGDARGERADTWRAISERIYATVHPYLAEIAPESHAVAQLMALHGDASPEDLIRWHGPGAAFLAPDFHPLGFFLPSPADQIISSLAGDPYAPAIAAMAGNIRALGRALREAPPPWVHVGTGGRAAVDLLPLQRVDIGGVELTPNRHPVPVPQDAWDPDLAFGLFAVAAVVTELRELATEERASGSVAVRESGYLPLEELPAFDRLRMTVAAHCFPLFASGAISEMEGAGLLPADQAFISRWHDGEVQLVVEPESGPVHAEQALDASHKPIE